MLSNATRGRAGAGQGGGVLSVIRGRVSPCVMYPRGLCLFFCLLLFWLGVGRGGARGRGLPWLVFVFVVCCCLCVPWQGAGADRGKAKPLSG
jgi:hypothetical protein